MITVRPAKQSDAAAWLQLRHALWPEGSEAEHRERIEQFFAGDAGEPLAVLLAEQGAGCAVGFAELSIRAYAEGCSSDRVAYLEGWFVAPTARGRGVGRALIAAAEEWGGRKVAVSLHRTRSPTTKAAPPPTARSVLSRSVSCGASGKTCSVEAVSTASLPDPTATWTSYTLGEGKSTGTKRSWLPWTRSSSKIRIE